jgi:UPF0755 protein
LYIETGADYAAVFGQLQAGILRNPRTFDVVARRLHYPQMVKPGRYVLQASMNNLELLRMLRAGHQTPVQFVLNKVRLPEDLAAVVAKRLEADSAEVMAVITNSRLLDSLGFNTTNAMCMFIPNTYEFWWNTSAKAFLLRMKKEHDRFWIEERTAAAAKIGLAPCEVYILASLVEEEYKMPEERSRIAGVFINRLNRSWALQADATLKFALRSFELKRVLNIHKEVDSPYNTYMYSGLPPGPICTPSISTIDAVLHAEEHDYYYYCAREDLSGYHHFTDDYNTHLRNAANYHKALNKRGIR